MNPESGSDNDQARLVDIEGVRLRIADRTLIEDFTLQLEGGERIGLTGPSGSGKTTMLRSIVGRQLTAGSTADRFELAPCRVGYVPQRGGLLPWYSVRRNLKVFIPLDEGNKEKWCEEVLTYTELEHIHATFPDQLSGGELQRARLACAFAAKPSLFCADEPLTEVGLQQKWRLIERWSTEMNRTSAALILVSHDLDTLLYLCDIVLILSGTAGQPAKTIATVDVPRRSHPRNLADLKSPEFERLRRMMIDTLYLGTS